MRNPTDLARELTKIRDAVQGANVHFYHEARMNAALHMSADVRPAPLAAAIRTAVADLDRLIDELEPVPVSDETREIAHRVPTAVVPRAKKP